MVHFTFSVTLLALTIWQKYFATRSVHISPVFRFSCCFVRLKSVCVALSLVKCGILTNLISLSRFLYQWTKPLTKVIFFLHPVLTCSSLQLRWKSGKLRNNSYKLRKRKCLHLSFPICHFIMLIQRPQ